MSLRHLILAFLFPGAILLAGPVFIITDDDGVYDEAVQDAHAIFESEAQHGSQEDFSVGDAGDFNQGRAAVMRFDVSDLAGANGAGSITLRLKVKSIQGGGATADIVIKRLVESVGDWDEVSVTRSLRRPGAPWFGAGTAPIQNPENVGAKLAHYGDAAAETFKVGQWIEIPIVPPSGSLDDLIADWNSGNNEGIRLEPDSYDHKRLIFHSSEASVIADRPQLVVYYLGEDPRVNAFASSSPRISAGESITLSWSVTNAASVFIDHDVGDVTALTTNGVGMINVLPTNTTLYTVTVTNADGIATAAQAGVRVIGPDSRPNIVLFYVDDMGWQDTSVEFHTSQTIYNRRYITPSMERLAERGMIFTQGYAPASVCSPSRYGIMTGRLPAESHWTYLGDGETTATIRPPTINPEPIGTANTIPRELQSLGYHTIQVGKWHLSQVAGVYAAGFDEKVGGYSYGAPGSYYGTANFGSGIFHVPDLSAYHGQNIFLSEALTREANKAIGRAVTNAEPFFLYMSHYAVHAPIQNDGRFTGHYDGPGDGNHYIADAVERSYATLVEGMDKSLGDIMDRLESLGVAEDTLIVFSSDHGGLSSPPRGATAYPNAFPTRGDQSHNWPLRYGKGWVYEGGLRVPFIASWATNTPSNPIQSRVPIAAGVVDDRFISQLDLFPTFVKLAGGEIPAGLAGYDITGYLTNNPTASRPVEFLWHQPHYRADHAAPHSTVMRVGDYKVIYWYETGAWNLFNLANDVSELEDLSAVEPERLQQLGTQMTNMLETIGAQYPTWVSTGEPIRPGKAQVPTPAPVDAGLKFYLLGNVAVATTLGDVYRIGATGAQQLIVDLIPPNSSGGMFYWQGFATDGRYFYLLNTDPNNGVIERVPLDGSSRTQIADIDPSPYGAIEYWKGFATDGTYFYLLMHETAQTPGRIDRINMDGTGRVSNFVAAGSNPVPYVANCRGFACDGRYFYFLNTDGTEPTKGTIYRTAMDGTGLTTIRDLSPTPFGNIQWYHGFAAYAPPVGTLFFIQ